MGYRRFAAYDQVAAAALTTGALPTSDDFIVTLMGIQNNGVGDTHRLRPNADGGANYAGVSHYGSTTPASNAQAMVTNGLQLAVGVANSLIQSEGRLTKVGNFWVWNSTQGESRESAGYRSQQNCFGRWNSGGAALSTFNFRWDIDGGTVTFTGRIEVWYREG